MTKPAAATRSLVVEREMLPEKIWRALTQGPLIEEWLMKNDFQPMNGSPTAGMLRAKKRRRD
jgi:uncharacterized protein YndB with AHSA1/START domain